MIIDICASILILSGLYYYGKKDIKGPLFSIAGCLMWIASALSQTLFVLAGLNTVLLILNARNAHLWLKTNITLALPQAPQSSDYNKSSDF